MSNFSQSFDKLGELKSRLLFLFIGILVYRIGSHIPVPGIDPVKLSRLFSHQQGNIIGLFNLISGGALSRLSVFALGLMPYISASIIIQLFTSVSPKLEQLKNEGESGRRKINQYTRYSTLFLALIQSVVMSKFLLAQGISVTTGFGFYLTTVVTLIAGTMFIMWLGEQITERGVGNGISLLIFAGIVANLPSAIGRTLEQFREGQISFIAVLLILLVVFAVFSFVVFVERAQRKIPVHYANKMQGRKSFSGNTSHLPLKINMSGVIPPIFASSIIIFPSSISQWLGNSPAFSWLSDIALALNQGQPLYIILFHWQLSFLVSFLLLWYLIQKKRLKI